MFVSCIAFYNYFSNRISEPKSIDAVHERASFNSIFDRLITDVTTHFQDDFTSGATEWLFQIIQYTVPGGKQNRGLSVINAYRHLVGRPLDIIEVDQTFVLGWCIEWLQAFFLVADDVMDNSILRRGKPCWYKQPHVGNIAINDSFLLQSCIYILLKKYFCYHSHYVKFLEIFHQIIFITEIGQALDLITSLNESIVPYSQFTFERYSAIVKYKTAYYSFYLPICLALYLCGIQSVRAHQEAKDILIRIGEFFQIQDDFLDCFGDPVIIGKIGTDIEEGKCCWPAVKAMELMSADQIEVFKANYGKDNTESVRIIKEMYSNLDIPTVYKQYELSSYNDLLVMINTRCIYLPKLMFIDFLDKIYKRHS